MNLNENIKAKGSINIRIIDKNTGKLLKEIDIKNLIVNAGKGLISGLVGNVGSYTAFGYMALGTSSTAPAVTDTTLGAEISTNGLSRTTTTNTQQTTSITNDTIQFYNQFTVTGSSTIQEVGIFNANSGGTMLGHALTGATSVVNGNLLQVTYKVQFT